MLGCNHETIPPLKTGVINIALMVEYRFYNEAVAYDGYNKCFSCWLKESDLYPDVKELYIEKASALNMIVR